MFETLRDQLTTRGIADNAVLTPGTDATPLDGALRLDRRDDGGFVLQTIDYGTPYPVAYADDESSATALLLQYLDHPLPSPVELHADRVESILDAQTPGFADLVARTQQGSLLVELPAELLVDRLGVLDGVHLFPYGTSVAARSLLPLPMQPGIQRFAFLTAQPLLARVQVAAPWFGQPGGGLRCTIADDVVGIRDLVVTGVLQPVRPLA